MARKDERGRGQGDLTDKHESVATVILNTGGALGSMPHQSSSGGLKTAVSLGLVGQQYP